MSQQHIPNQTVFSNTTYSTQYLDLSSKENIPSLQNCTVQGAAEALLTMFNNQCFHSTILTEDDVYCTNTSNSVPPFPVVSVSHNVECSPGAESADPLHSGGSARSQLCFPMPDVLLTTTSYEENVGTLNISEQPYEQTRPQSDEEDEFDAAVKANAQIVVPQHQHETTAGMRNFDSTVLEQQQAPFYEGLEFPNTSLKELRVILKNYGHHNNIKVNILGGSVGNKLGVACAYSGFSKKHKGETNNKKKVSGDSPTDSNFPSFNLLKAKKQRRSASVKSDCPWRIRATYDGATNTSKLTIVRLQHNHPVSKQSYKLEHARSGRHIKLSQPLASTLLTLYHTGAKPSGIKKILKQYGVILHGEPCKPQFLINLRMKLQSISKDIYKWADANIYVEDYQLWRH